MLNVFFFLFAINNKIISSRRTIINKSVRTRAKRVGNPRDTIPGVSKRARIT